MAQFIQKGDIVDYTNSGEAAIKYGQLIIGKDKIFVAAEEIAPGATGGVHTSGVFEMAAEATAAFAFGQKIYYDATNKVATATAETGSTATAETGSTTKTPNAYIGIAVEAKVKSAAVAKIKL